MTPAEEGERDSEQMAVPSNHAGNMRDDQPNKAHRTNSTDDDRRYQRGGQQ